MLPTNWKTVLCQGKGLLLDVPGGRIENFAQYRPRSNCVNHVKGTMIYDDGGNLIAHGEFGVNVD